MKFEFKAGLCMSSFVKFEENVGIKLELAVWHGEKKMKIFRHYN